MVEGISNVAKSIKLGPGRPADPRGGPPHGGELRQAAGATPQAVGRQVDADQCTHTIGERLNGEVDRGSATQARGGRELGTLRALLHRVPGVSRYGPSTSGLWLLLNTALFAQRAVRIDATLNRMIAGTAREYLAFVIAAAVGARAPPDYPHTCAAMLTDWIANPLLI
jgi:hypothetical protein